MIQCLRCNSLNLDNVEACAYCKKLLDRSAILSASIAADEPMMMARAEEREIVTPIVSTGKAQQQRPNKARPATAVPQHPDDKPSRAEQANFAARQAAKRNRNTETPPSPKAKSSPRMGFMLLYIGVLGYVLWRWLH